MMYIYETSFVSKKAIREMSKMKIAKLMQNWHTFQWN